MTYSVGEASALAILRTSDDFDETNSASLANNSPPGGYGRLDSGAAAQYAFLKPGLFERAPGTLSRLTTTWTTIIELWVRYADPSAYQTLAAVRESALSAFDKYAALGGMAGVTRSLVTQGGPVEAERSPGGGARYLRQDLMLVWDEESAPTLED